MNPSGRFCFDPVGQQETVKELVYNRILDAILEGQLQGGEVISQAELARQLGVSRGPVREALLDLEHDGLVINEPFRRTMIAPFDLDDLEELTELRILLEGYAVRRIVSSKLDLTPLQQVLQEISSLNNQGPIKEYVALEFKFHNCIIEIASRKHLSDMWSRIYIPFMRLLSSALRFNQQTEKAQLLLDTLEGDDAELAAQMSRLHIIDGFEDVRQRIVDREARGIAERQSRYFPIPH